MDPEVQCALQGSRSKTLATQEKSFRFGRFYDNYLFTRDHNQKYEAGEETFYVDLNRFADMDNAEFKSVFTGLKRNKQSATKACKGTIEILDNPPE